MSHYLIPAVVSLGDSFSWTSVSEEILAARPFGDRHRCIGRSRGAARTRGWPRTHAQTRRGPRARLRRSRAGGASAPRGRAILRLTPPHGRGHADHRAGAVRRTDLRGSADAASSGHRGGSNRGRPGEEVGRTDRTIVVRKAGGKAQPRVDLRRGGSTDAFWSIAFGEDWERDRFLDWFKWQDHRLHEFAAHLDANDPASLRSVLLREMIETEQLARRNKLATSGRRPLCLWCGKAE